MRAEDIARELSLMNYGLGTAAFFCYLFTLLVEPKIELTTDGFMICYGEPSGLHVFKFGDSIFCRMIHEGQHCIYAMEEQAEASDLYDKVMLRLLDEVVAA
jgi:hypothetical protein